MTPSDALYRFESTNRYSELTLLPALNESPWSEIEGVGEKFVNELQSIPSPALLVNLSQLNYMGSAMVALIVRLWKAVSAQNGQMVVVSHDPMIYEILNLGGLTKVWTIVETREQGLAQIKSGRRSWGRLLRLTLLIVVTLATVAAAAGAFYWTNR